MTAGSNAWLSRALALAVGVGAAATLLLQRRRRRRRQASLVEIDPADGPAPLPLALPEEVGLSSARLQQIGLWSDGWVTSGKMPGLLTMVARRGKLCYLHASGEADVEAGQRMAQNTIVRLYSLSKPLVSVCAMVLYERGYFQLDEPISHHLPSLCPCKGSNPWIGAPLHNKFLALAWIHRSLVHRSRPRRGLAAATPGCA